MFDFLSLKKSVGDFVAQVKKTRKEIADLQQRRADIVAAPCTREDLKARYTQYLEDQAGKYRESLGKSISFFHGHPHLLDDQEAVAKRMTVFGVLPSSKDTDFTRTFDGMAAALLPSLIGELGREIDNMEWPAYALPLQGRKKLIDDIDEKLEVLTRQESDLVSAAKSAGVIIE